MIKKYLCIETSCDDTSVAVLDGSGFVLAMESVNQDNVHGKFGGIVPEDASREHLITLMPTVNSVLQKLKLAPPDLDGIVVTNRPGLLGPLIVGVVTAKTLSQSLEIPWIGVNHLEGHIVAPFLKDEKYEITKDFAWPALVLAVSGGHTSLYSAEDFGKYKILGQTLDDAAGEAFDKFGKLCGLGWPGGALVDFHAQKGNPKKYQFPIPKSGDASFDFSFSGLKSAGARLISTLEKSEIEKNLSDLCASFQDAVVLTLLLKLKKAQVFTGHKNIILTGGVSANSELRKHVSDWCQAEGFKLALPPLRYCTDNAAMIGLAGVWRLQRGESSAWTEGPSSSSYSGDFL